MSHKTGDGMFVGFTVGITVALVFMFAMLTPTWKAQETECALRFDLAPTASDTVMVVADYSYCAKRLDVTP